MDKIKDVINSVIATLSVGRPDSQSRIQRLWEGATDKKTRTHTAIAGLDKGELIVHVDSPAWLFQVNLYKKKILEKFKTEIPEITNIRFKIGKVK